MNGKALKTSFCIKLRLEFCLEKKSVSKIARKFPSNVMKE